jgi:hypothetical protein
VDHLHTTSTDAGTSGTCSHSRPSIHMDYRCLPCLPTCRSLENLGAIPIPMHVDVVENVNLSRSRPTISHAHRLGKQVISVRLVRHADTIVDASGLRGSVRHRPATLPQLPIVVRNRAWLTIRRPPSTVSTAPSQYPPPRVESMSTGPTISSGFPARPGIPRQPEVQNIPLFSP